MDKPIIGLLAYHETYSESVFSYKQNMINDAYIRALLESNALPVLIPYMDDDEAIKALVTTVDGILIPGGNDIDPSLYGEENRGLSKDTHLEQDLFQKKAVEIAIKQKKPVMGICRGHQFLNAILGGKLIQDIPTEVERALNHKDKEHVSERSHVVKVVEGTILHSIMGRDEIFTNTLHHQAVRVPGEGMTVAAIAADGIIEATENKEKKIVSVQWHPEALLECKEEKETSRRLFDYFVSLAK